LHAADDDDDGDVESSDDSVVGTAAAATASENAKSQSCRHSIDGGRSVRLFPLPSSVRRRTDNRLAVVYVRG
jgi:hypothetical protein